MKRLTPGRGAGHGRELRKAFSRGPKHYCSQLGNLQRAERIALRVRKNSCRQGTPDTAPVRGSAGRRENPGYRRFVAYAHERSDGRNRACRREMAP